MHTQKRKKVCFDFLHYIIYPVYKITKHVYTISYTYRHMTFSQNRPNAIFLDIFIICTVWFGRRLRKNGNSWGWWEVSTTRLNNGSIEKLESFVSNLNHTSCTKNENNNNKSNIKESWVVESLEVRNAK